MKKLVGLSGACLTLMLAASLRVPAADAAPQLVSLVFNSALQSPQQVGADRLRQKLAELAGQGLSADERGGNTQGSEAAILAATRAGTVDLAVLSGSVVSGVVPELGVFDVPFLFRDANHAEAVANGPVGAAIATKFADKGLVLLAIGKQGFRNITNSKRPIRQPSDLVGLKIRVIPNEIYQMAFRALGADVVPMDFPLVYGALKDGRIDGQENPITTIAGSRFEDVQKYLSVTGHFFAVITFVANRDSFQRLSPADQASVMAAAQAGAAATWQSGGDVEADSLNRLRRGGMDVVDKIDRQPFIDAMRPLEPEFERRFGKALLASIRSTP